MSDLAGELGSAPLTSIKGVGVERARQLNELGVFSVLELLLLRPRRYEDRRNIAMISSLQLNSFGTVKAQVVAKGVNYYKRRTKLVVEVIFEDSSGRLYCRWWNQPYMEKRFNIGEQWFIYGKVTSLRPKIIDNPETEIADEGVEQSIHLGQIVPVYALIEGLSQRVLRSIIFNAIQQFSDKVEEPFPELLQYAKAFYNLELPERARAVKWLHFPDDFSQIEKAVKRFTLEEFFQLQLRLQTRRRNFRNNASACNCSGNNNLMKPFLKNLGFRLTDSQIRVLKQIRKDLAGPAPMLRLLQGDVGSGKTVVSACAALMAIESGYEVALMAPTEILTLQHYRTFTRWFEPLGVKVNLLTGSVKVYNKNEGKSLFSDHSTGTTGMITIGTHALIESGFAPEKLGLVIIDEQHKFGVAQREALVKKGRYPHILVMTATPIPRTLGLTIYGDLDISVIDALPPNRGRIHTYVKNSKDIPEVWEFVKQKISEGRQAYIVYSRLEESDPEAGIKAVEEEYDKLKAVFAPYSMGLVHGRTYQNERDTIMRAFVENKIQILLATSVIEVGLDVPNATVMVIENAEQFGLAQLHQLRGRIGRGAEDSYCFLIATTKTEEAKQRLEILAKTTNGFEIAEADLKLRGPGEFLGRRQSGSPDFRFGDLSRDYELTRIARDIAIKILES